MANKKFEVEFTDKKAKWHHRGMGKNPERPMLPDPKKNEEFKPKIMNGIVNGVKVSVERAVDKINRSKNLGVRDLFKLARRDMRVKLPPIIKGQIIRVMAAGESPVKNKQKYVRQAPYSESYTRSKVFKKYGKKADVVNLKLTGKLHNSLIVTSKS